MDGRRPGTESGLQAPSPTVLNWQNVADSSAGDY